MDHLRTRPWPRGAVGAAIAVPAVAHAVREAGLRIPAPSRRAADVLRMKESIETESAGL